MNKLIISLNIVLICIASIWCYKTKFDFEPVLALGGLVIGLIVLIWTNNFSSNSVKIAGNGNNVKVDSNNKYAL